MRLNYLKSSRKQVVLVKKKNIENKTGNKALHANCKDFLNFFLIIVHNER